LCSRCFGGVGGGAGLFFELDAFEGEKVLGASDGRAEGTVGVVELGTGGERGFLLGGGLAGEAVGVELAGLGVEGLLERGKVEVEVRREREEGEVVGGHAGLIVAIDTATTAKANTVDAEDEVKDNVDEMKGSAEYRRLQKEKS
jgi:hypothetical protein